MADETKSPWQREHARKLAKEAADKKSKARAERVRFLRRLKISRSPKRSLTDDIAEPEEAVQVAGEQIEEGEPDLNQTELSYEEGQLIDRRQRARSASSLAYLAPLVRKLLLPLIVFTLVYLGALYFLSPISKIGQFKVVGNNMVQASNVADASGLRMNQTLFQIFLSKGKIESRITNSSTRIEKTQLVWSFPNTLTVEITEFRPVGYVQQKGKYYQVLANGTIVKDSTVNPAQTTNSFVLNGFSDAHVKEFALAYVGLTPALQQLIRGVSITPTQATKDFITLDMTDTNQVKVPLSQMGIKLPYYPAIAKNITAPQVVDMEVGMFATDPGSYSGRFGGDVPSTPSSSSTSGSSDTSGNSGSSSSRPESSSSNQATTNLN